MQPSAGIEMPPVPGATLPADRPGKRPVAPAQPQPLDPDAARAALEQFEFGIARAMHETQPRP